ncbi:MAG: hypothetical protein N2D54_03215, partial [Chloroflexota bacterium]
PPAQTSPTPTTLPLESPTANLPVKTLNLDNLADFEFPVGVNTYRTQIEHSYTTVAEEDDDEEEEVVEFTTLTAEGAVNHAAQAGSLTSKVISSDPKLRQPKSQRRIISAILLSAQKDTCSMFNLNEGPVPDPDAPLTWFHRKNSPSVYLYGEATLVENGVMINGRLTDRYRLEVNNFNPEGIEEIKINILHSGDLYLDTQSGGVVRVVFSASEKDPNPNLEPPRLLGTINYSFNNTNFDEPLEINYFKNCRPQPLTQFPVVSPLMIYRNDGSDSYIELNTPLRIPQVANFYRIELAADNWTLIKEESYTTEDLILTFENNQGKHMQVDMFETPAPKSKPDAVTTFITISFLPY